MFSSTTLMKCWKWSLWNYRQEKYWCKLCVRIPIREESKTDEIRQISSQYRTVLLNIFLIKAATKQNRLQFWLSRYYAHLYFNILCFILLHWSIGIRTYISIIFTAEMLYFGIFFSCEINVLIKYFSYHVYVSKCLDSYLYYSTMCPCENSHHM